LIAPSHESSALAGVQKASRQQSSLLPFFHGVTPSAARQLSIDFACANAAIGAASAAVAKSTATLFNFFIDSPLEESRSKPANRPNRKAWIPGKSPRLRALTTDQVIVP
jgi:peptidoglycan/LPS O-acetylase OafA/YrhL